jgi:hypothetical protein
MSGTVSALHSPRRSVNDCALFCTFHHQVVIHQQGWTVVLNPDGSTTAWNKDRTQVLHSHGPPPAAGVTSAEGRVQPSGQLTPGRVTRRERTSRRTGWTR